jgi:hypothetical protein
MSDNKGKLAPSTENLVIGKGFIIFKPAGETDFFHLGNVPNFTFTPAVTKLDHFSSMAGTKLKDKSIVTEKTATVKITMEEFTKRNLGIMLMGDVNDTDPNNITIDVFSKTALTGELRFYATNDVGPRWRFFLNQVQFTPSGDFSPISDNYASMVITGDVFAVDGVWGSAALVSPGVPGKHHPAVHRRQSPSRVLPSPCRPVAGSTWTPSPISGRRAARPSPEPPPPPTCLSWVTTRACSLAPSPGTTPLVPLRPPPLAPIP